MLNYLKAFLFFLFWAAIALSSHYFITHQYFGNINKKTTQEIKPLEATTLSLFKVKNNTETVFSAKNGFTIFKNSELVSSADSIAFLVDSLTVFLANNYDKQLEIIGKYTNSEKTTLGISRANSLKDQLIKKGIVSDFIKTSDKKEPFVFNTNGAYSNGIELKFIPLNSKTLDSLESIISTKRLYVSIENEQLIENSELFKYVLLLKQYLIKHPAKKVEITGHTDNTGYFENNLIKGKIKSDKLKDYLIKKGISKTSINTFSRGEAEPIATKYTEEGKALNNRIEIRIN